jgi:hypothetical protein
VAPNIPNDQLERILPIVEALLADLRQRAQALPPECDLALTYDPQPEVRP